MGETRDERNRTERMDAHTLSDSWVVRQSLGRRRCSGFDGQVENVVNSEDDDRMNAVEHRRDELGRRTILSTHTRDCSKETGSGQACCARHSSSNAPFCNVIVPRVLSIECTVPRYRSCALDVSEIFILYTEKR